MIRYNIKRKKWKYQYLILKGERKIGIDDGHKMV
jgi:hypothetical protein